MGAIAARTAPIQGKPHQNVHSPRARRTLSARRAPNIKARQNQPARAPAQRQPSARHEKTIGNHIMQASAFKDILTTLPAVDDIHAIVLLDAKGEPVGRLDNQPGSAGSVRLSRADQAPRSHRPQGRARRSGTVRRTHAGRARQSGQAPQYRPPAVHRRGRCARPARAPGAEPGRLTPRARRAQTKARSNERAFVKAFLKAGIKLRQPPRS